MKGIKSWIWIGLIFLLCALVIQAPARLVGLFVPDSANLQISGVGGTLWNGRASQVVTAIGGQQIAVTSLRWQLSPWSLLQFSPTADLQFQLFDREVTARAQWPGGQRIRIDDADISLPASMLSRYINGQQVSGELSLRIEQLEMAGKQIKHLSGNISWQPARWYNGNRWMDFGALAGDLSQQAAGTKLKVFDLSGPLEIDGQLLLRPDGTLLVNGTVGLRPQAPAEFSQALVLFADKQPDGKYRIDFQY